MPHGSPATPLLFLNNLPPRVIMASVLLVFGSSEYQQSVGGTSRIQAVSSSNRDEGLSAPEGWRLPAPVNRQWAIWVSAKGTPEERLMPNIGLSYGRKLFDAKTACPSQALLSWEVS